MLNTTQQLPQTNNEEFYRHLIESSPDGIAIFTAQEIVFINAAGAKILGAASVEQILGKPIVTFAHPDYNSLGEQQIQQRNNDTSAIPFTERKFIRLDGADVQVEAAEIPITYYDERAVQLVFRDITERKQAETKLAEHNRQLTILQSTGAAIASSLDLRYILDTVAQEMTTLLEVEGCAISEWDQEANTVVLIAEYGPAGWWDPNTLGETYSLVDFPLTKWVLEEQIPQQMTISQSNIDPAELARMQEAGVKTLMMLPMVYQNRVLGLVELEDSRVERSFTYQEISMVKLMASQAATAIENAQLFKQARQEIAERKLAEAALEEERALLAQRVRERTAELSKANAELLRASRLKDEFLASMSHELRTPLNAILGSAEILETEVFGPLNEKQLKYSRNIDESGNHLLSLINDILDLSKIEAGKMDLDVMPVSIQSVCQSSLRLVKELAHKKELRVSSTIDDTITSLMADERRLKQILVNLLSNAIKFTPEGGEIGLDVIVDATHQAVRFTVWDTGIGISQEDMSQLFQPFVQIDSDLSRQYKGTGLGLSLVARMTELHGGGISVESEVGQGSRFTISLPYSKPGQVAQPVEETEPEKAQGSQEIANRNQRDNQPLILLAEDNEDTIRMLLDILEVQGYQTLIARNGREAIELTKEENPDVILMDIQMPVMDGLEATHHLRANSALTTVPIIAMTALAMSGDRERCLEAGMNEYMSKPVSPKQLIKTIETFLTST